ncbi:MAG: VWA domain-containing protein [Phycisphaeraceae bacterium]|nr:VWA domain-containing protein [Phycisphaeraceae bacterium]
MTGSQRGFTLLVIVLLCLCPLRAGAQVGDIPYGEQSAEEADLLLYLLTEDAWHYRCFGLFRLERYTGEEVDKAILEALSDGAWQVRSFALRAAARRGVEVPAGLFDKEPQARVIRMAQRVEVPVDPRQVARIAEKEMRSKVPERAVLGIEVAARSGDGRLQGKAKKRLGQLLQGMTPAVMVTIGDRLAELLDIQPAPTTLRAWQQKIEAGGKGLRFPEFQPLTDAIRAQPIAPIAEMDKATFTEAVDYIDTLHKQDLQIAVMIDGTGSMGSAIAKAQGQTNRLMLTLNDLAQSMEMGVVVYRDQGDTPMLEAVQMTDKIGKMREFLFKVQAKGGGDAPEAVYEGLSALGQLNWSSKATKQAVIITDAPAHEENMKAIENMVKEMRGYGITLHALMLGRSKPTTDCLKSITGWGGGTLKPLSETGDLAKTVIHYVIDPKMHETFDHLYDLYVEMGM